jgi:integrase
MRLGEIVALQIENLDFERNIIHVVHSYSSKERRIKETKTGKARIIFTDPAILRMLAYIHNKNPWRTSFIFYGLESDKPIREETLENYTEKAFADVFSEDVQKAFTTDRHEAAQEILSHNDIRADEIIAFTKDNLDTIKRTITIDHSYSIKGSLLKVCKFTEKRALKVEQATMKYLAAFCGKIPYVFIMSGYEQTTSIDFNAMPHAEAKKSLRFFGEIARKERNVSFHGFRHFFNSTIRGAVSDDTLRLQTGHSDAKMTDHYDHITDERGEQLRKAVQAKILPYLPKSEE